MRRKADCAGRDANHRRVDDGHSYYAYVGVNNGSRSPSRAAAKAFGERVMAQLGGNQRGVIWCCSSCNILTITIGYMQRGYHIVVGRINKSGEEEFEDIDVVVTQLRLIQIKDA